MKRIQPGYLASPRKSLYFDTVKKQIILRKNEEHRLLSGHQWIFSNEIKSVLGKPEAGDIVELLRHDEKFLGIGLYHPHSLIAFRLLSREREEVGFAFFEERIRRALELRTRIYGETGAFRLVNGESDFLPGLIIDKYNEMLALQTLSFGMDRRQTLIADVLESLFHPKSIVERNESSLRTLEQLPARKAVLRGTPDQTIIEEHGVKMKVDLMTGQKTGAFLDQRENHQSIRKYAREREILDVFCNEGGFSLHAGVAGARTVEGVDASEHAVARAEVNASLNHLQNVSFRAMDAFEALKTYHASDKQFDVVILDPPSFSRNKRTVATALKGYAELHRLAFRVVRPGGFLATASCSHHVTEEGFFAVVETSARKEGRRVQLLETSGAAPDHPVLPAMPETRYLKFGIFAVEQSN